MKYGTRAFDWASNAFLVVLICAVVAVLIAPHALGWRYGILRSGSMGPAIPAGAAIVVASAEAGSIAVGDVITYRSAGNRDLLVTHRVVEVTRDSEGNTAYRTKGDANEEADAGLVTPNRLVGRVLFSLPYVGRLAQSLRTDTGFLLFLVLPTALIVATELRELGAGIADLRKERKEQRQRKGGNRRAFFFLMLIPALLIGMKVRTLGSGLARGRRDGNKAKAGDGLGSTA